MASLLPAIALAPWLADQAHELLLSRAILDEKVFHKELETRLDLETERLVSVLENKSDPVAYFMSHAGNTQTIRELIEKINKRERMINSTCIYDTHAKLIFYSHQPGHVRAAISMDAPAFVVPMHQRVFIGSPSKLADKHFEFLISVPLIAKGKTIGVMVSTININDFWHNIREKMPEHNSQVYLVDGRGSMLIRQPKSHYKQGDLLSNHAIVRTLLAHKDWYKTETYMGFEHSRVFGIGTEVAGLGWGIISEIPEHKIDTPIVSALITLVIIVMLLHLIFGILGLLFARRLLSPISVMAEVMKQASQGDYKQAVIKSSFYQEIDDLSCAFNTMVREIDVRESSLRKQAYIMEHLGESLIVTDQHGVIEYVNPAFTRMTGYALDEVVGGLPKIINSGTQSQDFYVNMWATILAGNAWDGRLINRRKDGTLYPTLMSIVPVYHENKITNFIAVQQDMSKQVQLEDQLRQSQKMEAVGTLVGGIAHDFNNMLAGIMGNLYLLKRLLGESPDVIKKLDNIEALSFRAANMIKQLLTFSRQDTVRMEEMDITACVDEVLGFLHPTIPENITIHKELYSNELLIKGDETQLHQVLMNLINNARDALEDSDNPTITIRLARFLPDYMFMKKYDCFKVKSYAHISIVDNGMGISEGDIEHLFEPFFTTKEEGKGTGLGLSMVFGSIETHKGFIDVESKQGEGTAFHIYIPLLESGEAVSIHNEDAKQATSKPSNGEMILLVDDALQVRETTAKVLGTMGYKVLQAVDGLEAIEMFNQYQHVCSLVILDIVMPNCGGMEAARNIRAINPDMPIIFVSGYDRDNVLKGEKIAHSRVLSKPVVWDKLQSTIHDMLH